MSSMNGIKVKLNRRRSSLSSSFTQQQQQQHQQSPRDSPATGLRQKLDKHKRAVREKRDLLFQRNRHINEAELGEDDDNEQQISRSSSGSNTQKSSSDGVDANNKSSRNPNVKKSFIARFQNLINTKVKIATDALCSSTSKTSQVSEKNKENEANGVETLDLVATSSKTINNNMKRSQSMSEEKVSRLGMRKQMSARSIGMNHNNPQPHAAAFKSNIQKQQQQQHTSNLSLSSNDSKNSSGFGLNGTNAGSKPVFKVSRAIKYDDKYLYQQQQQHHHTSLTRKSLASGSNSPRSSPRK